MTMQVQPKTPIHWLWVTIVVALGCLLRGIASLRGYNYDFDAYTVVAEIVGRGEIVYAVTWRYNYGPIWFHILHTFDEIATLFGDQKLFVFRTLLISLLTFADLSIASTLWRRFGPWVAAAFFLNPVSILITGFHNQFDTLAIAIGLTAVQIFVRGEDRWNDRNRWLGLVLLGLSLMTKHIFFVLPLWLAFRVRSWPLRGLTLGLPVAIFLLGFAPYWREASHGIMEFVFRYGSGNNNPIYALPVLNMLPARWIWYGLLIGLALAYRNTPALNATLIYLGWLVAAAPAATNQYLVIPLALLVLRINWAFGLYILLATFHLMFDVNGLWLPWPATWPPFDRQVSYAFSLAALWLGLLIVLWRDFLPLRRTRRSTDAETNLPFGEHSLR